MLRDEQCRLEPKVCCNMRRRAYACCLAASRRQSTHCSLTRVRTAEAVSCHSYMLLCIRRRNAAQLWDCPLAATFSMLVQTWWRACTRRWASRC